MTREEAIAFGKQIANLGCLNNRVQEFVELAVKVLEQEPILDKSHIEGDYMRGYKNGLRTAKWRYDNAIKEIREHADRLKDSLYGDGLRHALDIIDKYKEEKR